MTNFVRLMILSVLAGLVLAGVAAMVLVGTGREEARASGSITAAVVEHFGLPDRQWQITDPGDIETLSNFLLGAEPTGPPNEPLSGYRGILLVNDGVADFPPALLVFGGVIEAYMPGGSVYVEDTYGMEDWLLARAPAVGGTVELLAGGSGSAAGSADASGPPVPYGALAGAAAAALALAAGGWYGRRRWLR